MPDCGWHCVWRLTAVQANQKEALVLHELNIKDNVVIIQTDNQIEGSGSMQSTVKCPNAARISILTAKLAMTRKVLDMTERTECGVRPKTSNSLISGLSDRKQNTHYLWKHEDMTTTKHITEKMYFFFLAEGTLYYLVCPPSWLVQRAHSRGWWE